MFAPKVNFLGRMQRLIKPGTTHQILRERKGKWDRWMKYSKATHQTPSQRKGKMNEVKRVKPGHLEPWVQDYVDEYDPMILNESSYRFQLRQICFYQGRSFVFFSLQRFEALVWIENSDIGIWVCLTSSFKTTWEQWEKETGKIWNQWLGWDRWSTRPISIYPC